jgi:NAD(P)H-dependent flavin oxidoreductase YrpB (nitropropane dioxygenase family)
MLRTPLCELLGLEVPILGAPMGPEVSSLELAAAVSNAGGLGMISFGGYPPPALKERIRMLRALTSRPFGVNVLLGRPNALCRKGAQGGHQGLRSNRFGEGGKTRAARWCRFHHRAGG